MTAPSSDERASEQEPNRPYERPTEPTLHAAKATGRLQRHGEMRRADEEGTAGSCEVCNKLKTRK